MVTKGSKSRGNICRIGGIASMRHYHVGPDAFFCFLWLPFVYCCEMARRIEVGWALLDYCDWPEAPLIHVCSRKRFGSGKVKEM
jgi:hypothetical protein